jgi:hypothetical protein
MKFDPRKVDINVLLKNSSSMPADVSVDSLRAYRLARREGSARIGVNMTGMIRPMTMPAVAGHPTSNTSADEVLADGNLVFPLWTDPVAYSHATDKLQVMYSRLPHEYTGCTGIALNAKVFPASPDALLKFWVVESSGEKFVAVREAPKESADIYLPFSEFIPDSSANIKLPPLAADGRLDLRQLDGWGIELMPLTEEPWRGKLYVRDAFSVKR